MFCTLDIVAFELRKSHNPLLEDRDTFDLDRFGKMLKRIMPILERIWMKTIKRIWMFRKSPSTCQILY